MKVLFDLDPAVYMSAFAAQGTRYAVIWEDEDQNLRETICPSAEDRDLFVDSLEPANCVLEVQSFPDTKPASFARQCAKTTISGALRKIEEHFGCELEVEYYLTGKGNFREEVATILEYKGNRKDTPKPVHYDEVRNFFLEYYGARLVEGHEADDEVSIRAWDMYRESDLAYPLDYVVVTIDKDLDQIPGHHYDYKKHVFYEVDELDGELFFYAQTLAGDATDNIQGCFRIGMAKARKLIDQWFEHCEEFNSQPRVREFDEEHADPKCLTQGVDLRIEWRGYVWQKIIETFEANMEKYPEKFPEGMTAEAAALENARMVYMQQERGEMWTP